MANKRAEAMFKAAKENARAGTRTTTAAKTADLTTDVTSEGMLPKVSIPSSTATHTREGVPISAPEVSNGSAAAAEVAATAEASKSAAFTEGIINIDKAMIDKAAKANKGLAYGFNKTNKQFNSYEEALKSGDEGAKQVGKALGRDDFMNLSNEDRLLALNNSRAVAIGNKLSAGPTMSDSMWGNKIPQKAGGALITAGLISSLSNSKGQQTNAQLYGQAPGPGM